MYLSMPRSTPVHLITKLEKPWLTGNMELVLEMLVDLEPINILKDKLWKIWNNQEKNLPQQLIM